MPDHFNARWQDSGKLKLMIIVGTRPEIIRLSEVIRRCRSVFDTLLVHTGQNYDYELNRVFFEDLDLMQPDICLECGEGDLGSRLGAVIEKTYNVFSDYRPEAVLVLGDTNSCLSVIGAKRLHIPVFHMEAGNRCRDERLPEEINRRIVDVISDVNLAYSEQARRNLIECGLPMERIFVTGSPMYEVLDKHYDRICCSDVLVRLSADTGLPLSEKKYFLLSMHREENLDDAEVFEGLFEALGELAARWNAPVIYSCHPRSRKRMQELGIETGPMIAALKPMSFTDYNCLQMNALCVISDSGTLPEESSYFLSKGHPFPAVSLRTSTERQEAMDKGCFCLSGTSKRELFQAVELAVTAEKEGAFGLPVPDYLDANVSFKVANIIQSYSHVVDNFVWRKDHAR